MGSDGIVVATDNIHSNEISANDNQISTKRLPMILLLRQWPMNLAASVVIQHVIEVAIFFESHSWIITFFVIFLKRRTTCNSDNDWQPQIQTPCKNWHSNVSIISRAILHKKRRNNSPVTISWAGGTNSTTKNFVSRAINKHNATMPCHAILPTLYQSHSFLCGFP